jgi:hypothetical protein
MATIMNESLKTGKFPENERKFQQLERFLNEIELIDIWNENEN